MSYDVDIYKVTKPACEQCSHAEEREHVFDSNYTSNIAYAMYEAAKVFFEANGLKWVDGSSWFYDLIMKKKASDVEPLLRFTVHFMRENHERLQKGEPENGWGSIERCATWLERVANACKEYPDGIMDGSA